MYALLEIALTNAALALLLAVVVFGLTRLWRNAHVARALWLLVLLKLVTPPLVYLPVLDMATLEPSQTAPPVNDIDDVALVPAFPTAVEGSWAHGVMRPDTTASEPSLPSGIVYDVPTQDVIDAPDDIAVVSAPVDATADRAWSVAWPELVAIVWLVGSCLCVLVAALRIARFRRALAAAQPAGAHAVELCRAAAQRLGLRRVPDLRVAEGNFSPLVWPVGRRSTILLPRRLAVELDDRELTTLVAHELAHLARRDHWVRWFELVCTVLYWWHPAVWWARRELSAAEDVCCDALVLERFPSDAPCYAEALVRAIEHAADSSPAPLLASQLGEKRCLRQRITMVIDQTLPRRMSWLTKLAVCAVGIAVLSITLTAAPPEEVVIADTSDDTTAAAEDDTHITAEPTDVAGSEPSPAVPEDEPRINRHDLLQVHVLGTPDDPMSKIWGEYRVELNGKLPLGPAYGRVDVKGLTLEEAEVAVHDYLSKILVEPEVMITRVIEPQAPNLAAHVESIGVLKKRIERAKSAYEYAKAEFENKLGSRSVFLQAQGDYEILQEQLKQTELVLLTRRMEVAVEQAEYDAAVAVNKRSPGTLSPLQMRSQRNRLQLAIAQVNEIAETAEFGPDEESDDESGGSAAATSTESQTELVYDGKTFSEWERLAQSEIEPEAQKRIIEAISALGKRGDTGRAIRDLEQIAATADVKIHEPSGGPISGAATEAVKALSEFGAPAVPALSELLLGESLEASIWAAMYLGELGQAAEPAIGALIQATRDDRLEVRYRAINALGGIGLDRDDVIPALVQQLDAKLPRVRFAAAIALANIDTPEAVAAAAPILRHHLITAAELEATAQTPVGEFGGQLNPRLDTESDAWRNAVWIRFDTLVAISALRKHGSNPEDRAALMQYARSDDAQQAKQLLSQPSLFSGGGGVPESNKKKLESLEQLMREAGVSAEEAPTSKPSPPQSSTTVPSEAELVFDGKTFSEWERLARTEVAVESQLKVIKALATLGRRGDAERAVKVITRIAERAQAPVGTYENEPTFNAAVGELYEFGKPAAAALVELLESRLSDPNRWRRETTVSTLGALGPAAEPVVPELLRLLREDTEVRRETVIESLVEIGGQRDDVVETLRGLVDSDDQAIELAAKYALAAVGNDDDLRSILPYLRQQFETTQKLDARNVVARMTSGHLPTVLNGLKRVGSEEDQQKLRQFANSELGGHVSEYSPIIETANPAVARQAVQFIKHLRGEADAEADNPPPDVPSQPDQSGLLRNAEGRVVGIWGISEPLRF